jgi:hypothetical protein
MSDPSVDTTPVFLIVDARVPAPFRDLLVEAEGCLRAGFLMGCTACIGRAMTSLFSLQGSQGAQRKDQLRELETKNAAAAPLIRALSHATNITDDKPWEPARLTLALVTLKAVAYELFVLGPERADRFAYVGLLLEGFSTAKEHQPA